MPGPRSSRSEAAPDAMARAAVLARPGMWRRAAGGIVLGYLLVAPIFLLGSVQRTLSGVFMFATLALAWNIIGGFAGYPSFGHVVFFGLGGYTVAVLMAKAAWPFWPALVAAALVGVVFATGAGLPVLRLRGHYFAIATLGLAEGMREVVINLPDLTGGGAGITIPAVGERATTSYLGETGFYFLFLALLLGTLALVWTVARSRFGYALRAIRQDEDGAAAMGINTTRAKTFAFVLSALPVSLAGASFAFQQVTIYPPRLFSVEITVLGVVMAVFGGLGTVLGPVIGAAALQLLSEYLRRYYLDWNLLIFGAIVVVSVIFLPQGVLGLTQGRERGRRLSLLANVRRYRL
jgi:branched-chain amino acid transport system permease protein